MRRREKSSFRFLRGQRGLTLIEVLVAVAIFAAIGVVFMTSINTAHKSVGVLQEKSQAEALALSQLEDIKNSAYLDSGLYSVTVDLPPQYSVNITATSPTCVMDGDNCTSLDTTTLQEITVRVYRTGAGQNRPVFSVACYKLK